MWSCVVDYSFNTCAEYNMGKKVMFSVCCFQVALHHLVCPIPTWITMVLNYAPLGCDWQDSFHIEWNTFKMPNLHVTAHLGWIHLTTPADHNQKHIHCMCWCLSGDSLWLMHRGGWSRYWIIIELTFLMTSVQLCSYINYDLLTQRVELGWSDHVLRDWRSAMLIIIWPTSSGLCIIMPRWAEPRRHTVVVLCVCVCVCLSCLFLCNS